MSLEGKQFPAYTIVALQATLMSKYTYQLSSGFEQVTCRMKVNYDSQNGLFVSLYKCTH